jgi:hypothetical protein
MYRQYNPNPVGRLTDDCTARALTLALDTDWETAFFLLALNACKMGVVQMDIREVWWSVLRQHGFEREDLTQSCPDCYTVAEFCKDHPDGLYIVGTDRHVVACINGDWYDSFDSGGEMVLDVWFRKDE